MARGRLPTRHLFTIDAESVNNFTRIVLASFAIFRHNALMKLKLTATSNATRRTRNRIAEHGPIFEDVTRELTGHNAVEQRVCLRAPDGWLGWLDIDEIQATSPMGSSRIFWPIDEDGDFRSAGWCVSNLHAWQRECIDGKAHLDPMDACGHESKPFPQRV